jgi:prevent-host-death family protein
MRVGTAELRNRLSYYVAHVRRGKRVIVTDRGHPVAELVPFDAETDLSGRIDTMVQEGVLTAERPRRRDPVRPVVLHRADLTVARLVSELRDGR